MEMLKPLEVSDFKVRTEWVGGSVFFLHSRATSAHIMQHSTLIALSAF